MEYEEITSNSLAHGSDYEGKNTKLTNTWKACVEFIRWYNENKTLI